MRVSAVLLALTLLLAVALAAKELSADQQAEVVLAPFIKAIKEEAQLTDKQILALKAQTNAAVRAFLAADADAQDALITAAQGYITVAEQTVTSIEDALVAARTAFIDGLGDLKTQLDAKVADAAKDGLSPYELAVAAATYHSVKLQSVALTLGFFTPFTQVELAKETIAYYNELAAAYEDAKVNGATYTDDQIAAIIEDLTALQVSQKIREAISDALPTLDESIKTEIEEAKAELEGKIEDIKNEVYIAVSQFKANVKAAVDEWKEKVKERVIGWLENATDAVVDITGLSDDEALTFVISVFRDGTTSAEARERIRRLAIALFVQLTGAKPEEISAVVEEPATNNQLQRGIMAASETVTVVTESSSSSTPSPTTANQESSASALTTSAMVVLTACAAALF